MTGTDVQGNYIHAILTLQLTLLNKSSRASVSMGSMKERSSRTPMSNSSCSCSLLHRKVFHRARALGLALSF